MPRWQQQSFYMKWLVKMTNEYIYLGYICGTHGLKGEIKIKSQFDKKALVFKPDFKLYIGPKKEESVINSYRHHKQFEMVTINDYNNINQVEHLITLDVYIKRADLKLVDQDYLLGDLIGLNVIENNEIIGKVSDIMYNKGNDLLVVQGIKQFYIPLQGNYIKKVDVSNQKITTDKAKELII